MIDIRKVMPESQENSLKSSKSNESMPKYYIATDGSTMISVLDLTEEQILTLIRKEFEEIKLNGYSWVTYRGIMNLSKSLKKSGYKPTVNFLRELCKLGQDFEMDPYDSIVSDFIYELCDRELIDEAFKRASDTKKQNEDYSFLIKTSEIVNAIEQIEMEKLEKMMENFEPKNNANRNSNDSKENTNGGTTVSCPIEYKRNVEVKKYGKIPKKWKFVAIGVAVVIGVTAGVVIWHSKKTTEPIPEPTTSSFINIQEEPIVFKYIVEVGDTVWDLEKRFNSFQIMDQNGKLVTENIDVGDVVYIYTFNEKAYYEYLEEQNENKYNIEPYVVKKGDTVANIAFNFDISVDTLLKLNPQIKDVNQIIEGTTIYVPTKEINLEQKSSIRM